MRRTAISLTSADTIYSADCIECCPFPGFQDIFICGTYQVLEASPTSTQQILAHENNGDIPAHSQTARTGRLLVYQVGEDGASVSVWLEIEM